MQIKAKQVLLLCATGIVVWVGIWALMSFIPVDIFGSRIQGPLESNMYYHFDMMEYHARNNNDDMWILHTRRIYDIGWEKSYKDLVRIYFRDSLRPRYSPRPLDVIKKYLGMSNKRNRDEKEMITFLHTLNADSVGYDDEVTFRLKQLTLLIGTCESIDKAVACDEAISIIDEYRYSTSVPPLIVALIEQEFANSHLCE